MGYRRFAQKHAMALGLGGWARNLVDGRVEIKVSGIEATLDQLCEKLKAGPVFSQVREVVVSKSEDENFTNFEVMPDQELEP